MYQFFFFFNDTATTEIYTLSLHDALPIFRTFFAEALASGGALVAVDRSNGHIIGSSRHHGNDAGRRAIRIGWWFPAPPQRGRGFNGGEEGLMVAPGCPVARRVLLIHRPEDGP